MWAITLLGGLLTAFFGWTGGRGDDYWKQHPKWPRWLLQSWTRDWLIGPVCAIQALIFGVHSWWLILMIGLTGAALSTYWDFLYPEEENRDNFFLHGFFIGMASLPIIFATGHWWMFAIRCVVLALWMGGWSAIFKDVNIEESGRYVIIGLTTWMVC